MAHKPDDKGESQGETAYYLDSNAPSIVQPIELRDSVREVPKFVQIAVTQVRNPKQYPLTFRVHYHREGQQDFYLGGFSLFPSDNPGTFIVATQGKVRNEGAIVLSLLIPDEFDSRDTIRVAVKRMKFLKE